MTIVPWLQAEYHAPRIMFDINRVEDFVQRQYDFLPWFLEYDLERFLFSDHLLEVTLFNVEPDTVRLIIKKVLAYYVARYRAPPGPLILDIFTKRPDITDILYSFCTNAIENGYVLNAHAILRKTNVYCACACMTFQVSFYRGAPPLVLKRKLSIFAGRRKHQAPF